MTTYDMGLLKNLNFLNKNVQNKAITTPIKIETTTVNTKVPMILTTVPAVIPSPSPNNPS